MGKSKGEEVFVTYKALALTSATNIVIILSFVVSTLLSVRSALYSSMDTRSKEYDIRVSALSTDIDNMQIILMQRALLGKDLIEGEKGETKDQDTSYLCVDIPDYTITVGRVDTRKQNKPSE